MPKLMLSREILLPPGYEERSCLLVRYRLPLLRHCFVLCHEPEIGARAASDPPLSFFVTEAGRLALEAVGDSRAFMFIHSGASIRRRANFHAHVFVVQYRWQKAWVYTILAAKNVGLAIFNAITSMGRRLRPSVTVSKANK